MRRATFWFIFGTVLLDMLALGIIAPVFPKLVIQLERGNDASAASALGMFGTVWAAMQFVFAPVLGALSDRVGRRPVILLSCLGLALDYAIMALAPTVAWLFVGRVLSGITASSFSTSFAYIADVTEPDERAARFGLLGMAFGFALGGVGVVSMIVQGGLVGAAVKRLGESRALIAGLAFGAVAFTLYGLAPTGALFLLGIPIGGLFGLTYPALQGLMTRRVGADEQGRLQGAIASVMGIAGVIAPVLPSRSTGPTVWRSARWSSAPLDRLIRSSPGSCPGGGGRRARSCERRPGLCNRRTRSRSGSGKNRRW